MNEAGFSFRVEKPGIDESFPPSLPASSVASYLATKKAESFRTNLREEIVITADTVVILDNKILNKPVDPDEAVSMLTALSGRTHIVITGVSIVSKEKEETFDETTEVTFYNLTTAQIHHYVDHYKPFDKAGAYGAQDCLPAGVNPCSAEELEFLKNIRKPELAENSFTHDADGVAMVAIQKISGSYFNVMGLPVHKVYQHLIHWP